MKFIFIFLLCVNAFAQATPKDQPTLCNEIVNIRVAPAQDSKTKKFTNNLNVLDIIPNSVYAKFEFKKGDIIIEIDGIKLNSAPHGLLLLCKLSEPGGHKIRVLRETKELVLK